MAATYTTSLKLTMPADGDTGWGTTVNTGITALVDASVAATAAVYISPISNLLPRLPLTT